MVLQESDFMEFVGASMLPLIARIDEAIGLIGVLLYLGAYFALQSGLLRGQSYAYPAVNMAAAGCVLFDLQTEFNLPAALIQISWIAISLFGIARLFLLRNGCRFTPEERAFVEAKLADMEPHRARRLLNAGRWEDRTAGAALLQEGRCAEELVYIAEGEVTAWMGGYRLYSFGAGAFVGELICLRDSPATADWTLTAPSRCFAIPAPRLRALADADSALRVALEAALAQDAREKMCLADAALRQHTLVSEAAVRVP